MAAGDPASPTPSFTAPAVESGGLVVTDKYAPNPKASLPATVLVTFNPTK